MERFDFFFGLHLGGRLHSHTNNLSKDLQGTDWRLVMVHQATPKLPKITLEGYVMKLLILSSVLSIRKASAPTLRWRPSWSKLVMVTTMRQISLVSWSIIQRRCWYKGVDTRALIQGRRWLSVCFDEILLPVSKFPEPEKKLIQKAQTICKLPTVNPATSPADERSFSSLSSSVKWSQAENRQCLYSYTGVCFPQLESQEKLQHLGGLFNISPILDSITRVDVYVIFVEVVNKMASKSTINGETSPDFLALSP